MYPGMFPKRKIENANSDILKKKSGIFWETLNITWKKGIGNYFFQTIFIWETELNIQ